jgi:hypothetical protein
MRANVKEVRNDKHAVQRTPEGMVEKEFYPGGFNATAFVWHCLSDTVDPRGGERKVSETVRQAHGAGN